MNKVSFAIKVAILPLAVLSLQTQISHAADGVELTDNGLELTVTANRKPQSLDKTLASVTVITRKQIEDNNTQDLISLLRNQRGVSIARTGGVGSQTSLFMRGTESDHTLVMLDGVRIASNTTGFDWSQLPLDQIERIEIVRGPRAALYGSDAIGGVVEITSRQGTRPYITLQAGKYGTEKVSAGYSKITDRSQFSINASHQKAEGFSATNSNAPSWSADPDKDGIRKMALNLSASHQLNEKVKVGFNLFDGKNDIEFDIGTSISELESLSGFIETNASKKWSHKLSLSKVKNEIISSSSFSEYTTEREEINWQNNIALDNSLSLIIGANYREEKGKTASQGTGSVDNAALYVNLNKQIGSLNLDGSIRHDNHSNAGNKTTGQLAIGYDLSKKSTVYASYGEGFKAPGINDLYAPGFNQQTCNADFSVCTNDLDADGNPIVLYQGNQSLKPETSKSFEVGLKSQISNNARFEASLFRTNIRNLINNSGEYFQSVNIDKTQAKGLEFGYERKLGNLNIGLDVTFLRTLNENTGERLVRRPDRKVGFNLAYAISDQTTFGMDAITVSSRSDVGNVTLDSYSLFNLSANHKFSKHSKIGFSVENLLNEEYELVSGYNTPGRSAYLSFTYN